MAEIKLLPCPFCGGEIDVEKNIYMDFIPTFYDPDSGEGPITIACDCGSMFSTKTANITKAAELWNHRATESEIRAKAIAEFAEKLKGILPVAVHRDCSEIDYEVDFALYSMRSKIDEIAEQLLSNCGVVAE